MSHRDFTEVEPQGTPELPPINRKLFLEKVRQSNAACQNGDFSTAVALYTDALQLDPSNHILYSNRSAARLKQGLFAQALQDATAARDICPTWPKAYYRQGVALQCLDRHGEALAAFSSGLAQDPSSQQLLSSLIEASLKSPLKHNLEPTFQQLQLMKLDKSPFVLISVVGQELLSAGIYHSAITVLESALKIGSCSLKLRGSVFSALSSAHWALNDLDKAIGYMQQDLAIAKSLGDTSGECRAHGNLGSAYFSQGSHKEALTAHRYQLVLAMKCKDTQAAASALTSLGHVYTAIGDYPNALASHKQCVQLVKQIGDRLQEAREIGNVGAVYLAMGDFDSAVDCHTQHLRISRRLGNQIEEARAFSNLGSSYHYRRNFNQAIVYHEKVLRLAQIIGDKSVEARAYAGLGHASRCGCDYLQAKHWHERQLDMALSSRDKVGEGRACSNLGIVYQLLGEYDAALKLHQAHLQVARSLQDRAGMGRAYGNIGNAYSAAGFYESAIKYHKQELQISKEVHDRTSEASTHGNLAVAYQAIGAHDMALLHYRSHLGIARELKDTAGEACALLNLGNCLSSRSEFSEAIPYYEQYLMLSQELSDVEGEAKACHFLGYAHYCIGNFREAVRYYDQDLALAKDLQDKMNMGRAYCNLGLAHLALNQLDTSLECQKYFLAIAHMTNNLPGRFRALGNIGDVVLKMNDVDEAIKMYHRQLALARNNRDRNMEAAACGALGSANRLIKRFDKALGYHTQELTLRQEMSELLGECRAHGHLGSVFMSLGNYTHAVKCYQEQLERAQELQDSQMEAQAYGNLGLARLNMGHYEDAIGYLEQQLGTLELINSDQVVLERARAFGSLGDCYDALGDPEDAVKCHEQYLSVAKKLKSLKDLERAYRCLGQSQKCLGNLPDALVCLEKRLVIAHELNLPESKAQAYFELGQLHLTLNNLDQSISCLEHQQSIAIDLNDKSLEADALSMLGLVYHQVKDYTLSLKYHQEDLDIAQELNLPGNQSRACSNLGIVYESLGDFQKAVYYQEQTLGIAATSNDQLGKTLAYSALGRVHQLLGNKQLSISYLKQGLEIAEALNRCEEECKIKNRLGLALWSAGDLDQAKKQLEDACGLLEGLRKDSKSKVFLNKIMINELNTSYQVLQRVLIELNLPEEALVVAERYRLKSGLPGTLTQGLPNQTTPQNQQNQKKRNEDLYPLNIQSIFDVVNRQRANILYYSIAAGYLYSWLIAPTKGIVKFNAVSILSEENELQSQQNLGIAISGKTTLEKLVMSVKDSLGEELSPCNTINEDLYQDDALSDRPGFLRMVNRSHLLNSSNYSLSSLFSVGSVGGSVASLRGSSRSSQGSTRIRSSWYPWKGPSCFHSLYSLLLQPFEEFLMTSKDLKEIKKELVLVLEGDLFLVPFPVLRPNLENSEYLCEKFSLLTIPNLGVLNRKNTRVKRCQDHPGTPGNLSNQKQETVKSLIVGNPKLPSGVLDQLNLKDIPQSEHEATMVAELLQTRALTGSDATKLNILSQLQEAECVHLATHVSWKLSSLVLSPGEVLERTKNKIYLEQEPVVQEPVELEDDDDVSPDVSPNEFLLSPLDITTLKMSARLVVVSSSHTRDQGGWADSQGLGTLVKSLLQAGTQCVLLSLWPVPDTATKILLRAFYSSLLQGTRAARALSEAMQTVQHTKHFAHPANWAGFLLVGFNVRLSNKVALMGQALCELLKVPEKCRDALRVTLHLVEKSLQRIHRGQKNAMYTTQKSIENKVGTINGWKELLMSVGFRFEPASNGIPSSVFFPQSDPDERLTQCSASLQALLGLTPTSLFALSKLTSNFDVADDIIAVIQSALGQFNTKNLDTDTVDIGLNVRLWQVPGCHELLASLGFDLCDVGQDKVTLRTSKQSNRRNIQFTLQALLALFDTQEAPKSLTVDSSSSMESLPSDNEMYSDGEIPPPQCATLPMRVPPFSRAVIPRKKLGGAFTSYVRRRGEPDGRTANPPDAKTLLGIDLQRKQTLARPGGGESDAAFTPSPPVVLQGDAIAMGLAHQTKIRSLYPQSEKHRPDSSSSSSVTDWENSGLNTVLRRSQPPLPPPRIPKNLLDMTPLYNNLPSGFCENSSDSELEKMFSSTPNVPNPLKLQHNQQQRPTKKPRTYTLDRLSVRTEGAPVLNPSPPKRNILALSEENLAANTNERLLYFRPNGDDDEIHDDANERGGEVKKAEESKNLHDAILATQLRHINREMTPTISEVYHERNIGLGLAPPLSKLLLNQSTNQGQIQGQALVQGQGQVAMPQVIKDSALLDKISLNLLEEEETGSHGSHGSNGSQDTKGSGQGNCGGAGTSGTSTIKIKSKPWLTENPSMQQIHSSDLTTADILEREVKNKSKVMTREATRMTLSNLSMVPSMGPSTKVPPEDSELKRVSPFSEMSRRDEGDGRSIADSSCSSYKGTQFRAFGAPGEKTLTRLRKTTHAPHVPVPVPMVRRTKPN